MYYIGVDIGGTFTDCVLVDREGNQPHGQDVIHQGRSGVGGAGRAAAAGRDRGRRPHHAARAGPERFGHGTTIGTNAVLERSGARVGLVATAGHADALAMMRGAGRVAGRSIEGVFLGTRQPAAGAADRAGRRGRGARAGRRERKGRRRTGHRRRGRADRQDDHRLQARCRRHRAAVVVREPGSREGPGGGHPRCVRVELGGGVTPARRVRAHRRHRAQQLRRPGLLALPQRPGKPASDPRAGHAVQRRRAARVRRHPRWASSTPARPAG